jgi:hydrogenase maturation protease
VDYIDGGTLGFTLAPSIEAVDRLIVFDAAQLGAAPGSVRLFIDDEMDHFLRHGRRSVHEVGLADALTIACLNGSLPCQRALIGIQPARIEWGETPTEAVRVGIERAVDLAATLLEQWPVQSASAPRPLAATGS